jgi:hypothetical protein
MTTWLLGLALFNAGAMAALLLPRTRRRDSAPWLLFAISLLASELAWIWFRGPDELDRLVRCDDLAPLADAHALGRGVLVLTPHSPLGRQLMGRKKGDRWKLQVGGRPAQAVILGVY